MHQVVVVSGQFILNSSIFPHRSEVWINLKLNLSHQCQGDGPPGINGDEILCPSCEQTPLSHTSAPCPPAAPSSSAQGHLQEPCMLCRQRRYQPPYFPARNYRPGEASRQNRKPQRKTENKLPNCPTDPAEMDEESSAKLRIKLLTTTNKQKANRREETGMHHAIRALMLLLLLHLSLRP